MEQWKTLAGRLQWVLDKKLVKNESAWAREALKDHRRVTTLKKRSNDSWTNKGEEAGFEWVTIEALARVARISAQWLALGLEAGGLPYDRETIPLPEDAYPKRALAIALSRLTDEVGEPAIKCVQKEVGTVAESRTAMEWLDEIRNAHEALARSPEGANDARKLSGPDQAAETLKRAKRVLSRSSVPPSDESASSGAAASDPANSPDASR